MNLIVVEDHAAVSQTAAEVVAASITENADLTVVAATGTTPMDLYGELANRRRRGELVTSGWRVFQLDEYVGIPADDRRSLYQWMKCAVLDPLAIPADRTVRLRGDAADLVAACDDYDLAIESSRGLDLAILGLGPNGHLGFNEPPSDPTSPTRVVTLSAESIRSNAAYWGDEEDVPRCALTAGMTVLLSARHIVLVVSGGHKRGILERVLRGPVTPEVPASHLQSCGGCTVIADRLAAGHASA